MSEFKNLSQEFKKIAKSYLDDKPVLCNYITDNKGFILLKYPILSSEHKCQWCGGSECFTPLVDPIKSKDKTWLCANPHCFVYTERSVVKTGIHIPERLNALEWVKFCELNDIGNMHQDVRFEKIKQSPQKISYMLKFVASPVGVILMEGETGTGKTYAAMAICELYIRKNGSAVFITQEQLYDQWLSTFKNEGAYSLQRFNTCCLLVIDDFGLIKDLSDKFLGFFMKLINFRLQWNNKGTVITTNLNLVNFNEMFGNAFSDRLKTGQRFLFKEKSRRKSTIL